MKKVSIKLKIYVLIGILFIVSVFVGGFGLYSLKKTFNGMETVFKDRVIPLRGLKEVSNTLKVSTDVSKSAIKSEESATELEIIVDKFIV